MALSSKALNHDEDLKEYTSVSHTQKIMSLNSEAGAVQPIIIYGIQEENWESEQEPQQGQVGCALGRFEKYLPVWIVLCMTLVILLCQYAPAVATIIDDCKFYICLLLMMCILVMCEKMFPDGKFIFAVGKIVVFGTGMGLSWQIPIIILCKYLMAWSSPS
eukprot:UN03155